VIALGGAPRLPYGDPVPWSARAATAATTAALLLAGCGAVDALGTAAPGPAPGSAAPAPAPDAAGPATTAPALPWPADGPAEVAALQAAADGGAQPWLLDPSEVALAWATGARGWVDAEAYPGPGGTSVDIRAADRRATLILDQPGRTGEGGIWVVTAEQQGD
jgi:hypothetical protein